MWCVHHWTCMRFVHAMQHTTQKKETPDIIITSVRYMLCVRYTDFLDVKFHLDVSGMKGVGRALYCLVGWIAQAHTPALCVWMSTDSPNNCLLEWNCTCWQKRWIESRTFVRIGIVSSSERPKKWVFDLKLKRSSESLIERSREIYVWRKVILMKTFNEVEFTTKSQVTN